MPSLTAYIAHAMGQARFSKLDSGSFYAEIPDCPGVWAEARTKTACKAELQEVLEDWLLLKLRDGDTIPSVGNFELKLAV